MKILSTRMVIDNEKKTKIDKIILIILARLAMDTNNSIVMT